MGKSNRIKSAKAAQPVKTVSSRNNKKKDNSKVYGIWVALIAVFVLVMVIFTTITSSGIIMRHSKAISSENYTMSGSVLTYMLRSKYEDFLNNYSSYLSYFSLDTSKSLKAQEYGEGNEKSILGEFEGTWYDYFMSSVKEEAKQLLVLCELAKEKGIELDESDKKEINSALDSLKLTASSYGYSLDAYIGMVYGEGIKTKDLREAFEISTLASKSAEALDAELNEKITDDRISKKYEDNKRTFNVVDFAVYPITVDYTEVAKDVIEGYDGKATLTDEQKATVLTEYTKRIADAKAKAETFEAYTTVDAFVEAMYNDIADTSFDKLYKSEALADADKLSDADLAEVKAAMIAKVIEEVKAEKEAASVDTTKENDAYTAYGKTVTENAAKAIDSIKADLFDEVSLAYDFYSDGQTKYNDSDEFAKWAFEEATEVGDTYVVETGDGANDAEVKNEKSYFDATVYMIKATEYCDKTLSKNVAYMTFSSEETAKKAIESLKADTMLDKANFDAIATSHAATMNGSLENYREGELSYNGFETWLYDDETVVGSFTEEAIPDSSTTPSEYAIFYYFEDGLESWEIDVRNSIFVEDYQAYYESLTEKYPVVFEDKVLNKIDM